MSMAATGVAVRMRKVLARPWGGVRVCHLLLLLFANSRPLTPHGRLLIFFQPHSDALFNHLLNRRTHYFDSIQL